MFEVILLFTSYGLVSGTLQSTCYEDESYCLFSMGPTVLVNNISEAQKICAKTNQRSWPVKIFNTKILNKVEEFLSAHSFPENVNLILGDEKVRNTSKWMTEKLDVTEISKIQTISNGNEEQKFYRRRRNLEGNRNESIKFSIICMIDCPSKITEYHQKRYLYGVKYSLKTREECLERCETSECAAWEWDSTSGCWIHKTIKEKDMTKNLHGILYVMDKSVKSTSICINDADIAIAYMISSIVILAMMLIIINLFWLRKKQAMLPDHRNENMTNITVHTPEVSSGSILGNSRTQLIRMANNLKPEDENKDENDHIYLSLVRLASKRITA